MALGMSMLGGTAAVGAPFLGALGGGGGGVPLLHSAQGALFLVPGFGLDADAEEEDTNLLLNTDAIDLDACG